MCFACKGRSVCCGWLVVVLGLSSAEAFFSTRLPTATVSTINLTPDPSLNASLPTQEDDIARCRAVLTTFDCQQPRKNMIRKSRNGGVMSCNAPTPGIRNQPPAFVAEDLVNDPVCVPRRHGQQAHRYREGEIDSVLYSL